MTNRFIQLTFFRRTTTIQNLGQLFESIVSPETRGVVQGADYMTLSSDLKVSFKIDSISKGWQGSIKIFNLSNESSEFLLSSDSDKNLMRVYVDAGYTNNHGAIASLFVKGVQQYKESGDFITEILVTGKQSQLNQKSAMSFSGIATAFDIVTGALDDAMIPWVDDITPYIEKYGVLETQNIWTAKDYAMGNLEGVVNLKNDGYSYTGTVKSVLDKYIIRVLFPVPSVRDSIYKDKPYRRGIKWRPCSYREDNNGVIHFTVPEELLKEIDSEVFLSADTGLIEIPRPSLYIPRKKSHKTKKKLEIKHTLIPQIKLGGWVHLKLSGKYSKFKDGGKYLVSGIRYRGNNYDGEHTVSIEVRQ